MCLNSSAQIIKGATRLAVPMYMWSSCPTLTVPVYPNFRSGRTALLEDREARQFFEVVKIASISMTPMALRCRCKPPLQYETIPTYFMHFDCCLPCKVQKPLVWECCWHPPMLDSSDGALARRRTVFCHTCRGEPGISWEAIDSLAHLFHIDPSRCLVDWNVRRAAAWPCQHCRQRLVQKAHFGVQRPVVSGWPSFVPSTSSELAVWSLGLQDMLRRSWFFLAGTPVCRFAFYTLLGLSWTTTPQVYLCFLFVRES